MEGNLWISETFVNVTRGYTFGIGEPYETFTDNVGELFRSLQKEYGAAAKMYITTKDDEDKQTGWVFSKKMQYEDAEEYYTREVWVNVLTGPDEIERTRHFYNFN